MKMWPICGFMRVLPITLSRLFLEYHFGWQAAQEYVRGLRFAVSHDRPVIPDYGVNERGSGDMYYRGSNFLHTLRAVVANDSLWREMLLGLNRQFYHQTVGTEALVGYMEEGAGLGGGSYWLGNI